MIRCLVCPFLIALAAVLPGCGTWTFSTDPPPAQITSLRCEGVGDAPVKQVSPVGCWAACAEMIYRYNGKPEQTQARIAERIGKTPTTDKNGRPLTDLERAQNVRAACEWEIMLALYPEFSIPPEQFVASAWAYYADPEAALKGTFWNFVSGALNYSVSESLPADVVGAELAPGRGARPQPLLAGLQDEADPQLGHVCLVYGMDFVAGSQTLVGKQSEEYVVHRVLPTIDQGEIYRLHLVDPADGSTPTRTPAELSGKVNFFLSSKIAKQRLDDIRDTIMPVH